MELTNSLPFAECRVSELPVELAVVIPTYNERENISPLLNALRAVLIGKEWEVIFVDDNSPDGTAEYIRKLAARDRGVRVIERIGRRGLSSACIEGMLATPAPYIAVMDGDLQHDESILPKMLGRMIAEDLDVVVASRNVPGGSMGDFTAHRVRLSRIGTKIGRLVCNCDVSDAMSGFFLVKRTFFQQVVHQLTGSGFKILMDMLASSPTPIRIGEVPYHFRDRRQGESKLDINAQLEYLLLVLDKVIGGIVPVRFILFVLIGSLGVLIHLSILAVCYYEKGWGFIVAQSLATAVAMTSNFILNNLITFRDRRLRGWKFVTGLLLFYLACSVGAFINIRFARFLIHAHQPWYLAGIAGLAISSVWNYGVNTVFTWRRSRIRA